MTAPVFPRRHLLLLLIVGMFLFLAVNDYLCVFEDAFISYRYAANLADGKGLTFNAGERVWGYSNPLWTLALALCAKLGIPMILGSKCLGLAVSVAVIVLLTRGAEHLGLRGTAATLFAPLLYATSTYTSVAAQNGMETALFTALSFAGVMLFLRCRERSSRFPSYVLLFLLASLTRPEGPLFMVAALVLEAFSWLLEHSSAARSRLMKGLLVFTALYGTYLLIMYSYYGSIVPNSFHVKVQLGSLEAAFKGIRYVFSFVVDSQAYILIVLSLLSILEKERRRLLLILGIFLAAYLAFVISVGGDFTLYCYRFIVPMLPPFFLLAAVGFGNLVTFLRAKKPAFSVIRLPVLAAVVAFNLVFLCSPFERIFYGRLGPIPSFYRSLSVENLICLLENPAAFVDRVQSWFSDENANIHGGIVAAELTDRIEPGSTLAACQCGQIPFYLPGTRIIDLCGLMIAPENRYSSYYSSDYDNVDHLLLFYNETPGFYYFPQTLFPYLTEADRFKVDFKLAHVFRHTNRLSSRDLVFETYYLLFSRNRTGEQEAPGSLKLAIQQCISSGAFTDIENRLDWSPQRQLIINPKAPPPEALLWYAPTCEQAPITAEATSRTLLPLLEKEVPGNWIYTAWAHIGIKGDPDRTEIRLSAQALPLPQGQAIPGRPMTLADLRFPGKGQNPLKTEVDLCRRGNDRFRITASIENESPAAGIEVSEIMLLRRACDEPALAPATLSTRLYP